MKTKIFIIFIFIIEILFAKINLYDCINGALENSFEVKIEKQELLISKYELQNNYFSFIPQAYIFNTTKFETNDQKKNSNGLSISEKVYLFDERFSNTKINELSHIQNNLNLKEEKQKLVIEILDLFLSLQILNDKIEYYTNIIELYQKQLKYFEEIIKVGNKNILDIYSIKIEIKNNEIILQQQENQIIKILDELNFKTGLSIKNISELEKFNIEISPQLIEFDHNDSYGWKSNQITFSKFKINKKQSLISLFPSIFLDGSLNYYKENDFSESSDFFKSEWNKTWEISLNFQYFFGSILQKRMNYKICKKRLFQQNLKLEKLEKELQLQIKGKKNDLLLKEKEINLHQDKIELAKQKFQISRDRFQSGLIDFFEFKNDANEMISANISLSETKKNYLITIAEYEKLLGKKILKKY